MYIKHGWSDVILHLYFPTKATSTQQSVNFVFKVAVIERFHCNTLA